MRVRVRVVHAGLCSSVWVAPRLPTVHCDLADGQGKVRKKVRVVSEREDMLWARTVRNFSTSLIRRSHYEEGPGKNLPFSVENKWRLLAMMTVFFGSGFAAPFVLVWHQMLKK